MAVDQRHYIRPDSVNFAMDDALRVAAGVVAVHRFAVEVVLDYIRGGDHAGWPATRQEKMIRIALAAHADVAVGVEDPGHRQNVVREDQLADLIRRGLCRLRPR